MAVNMILVLPD